MVVKIQRIYFFKEKEFAKWVLDNTTLAEKTLYSRQILYKLDFYGNLIRKILKKTD